MTFQDWAHLGTVVSGVMAFFSTIISLLLLKQAQNFFTAGKEMQAALNRESQKSVVFDRFSKFAKDATEHVIFINAVVGQSKDKKFSIEEYLEMAKTALEMNSKWGTKQGQVIEAIRKRLS
jgi:hypothetical protein